MNDFIKNHTLIFGTLFLTGAGFLSRILGFFYRIFLSRAIGAEGLGIYQMIFPVYGICFSLCAGSIQTAISRFTAAEQGRAKKTLFTGFVISFSISLLLAAVIWNQAEFIAVHILMEARCAPLLPALALAIPFSSLHACICGYYYGREKVHVPAIAQLVEQCIRIFSVFLVADIWQQQGKEVTALVAALGLLAGEAGSALFSLTMFFVSGGRSSGRLSEGFLSTARPLMALAMPLMANRLVMNVLQSAEAILIPNQLEQFGLTNSQAVSIYGILTGMAMPFIMFPSAIVNSLAVVLLPTVARQQAANNDSGIMKNISMSFRYSLYMGILCIGIFTMFGDALGMAVFQNRDAGTFITILAWLCPFLYLATTMGSILNGLGKTTVTFLHNLASLLVRLLFVFFGIPHFGIHACLWGMLVSEIMLALLHLNSLKKLISFSPNVWNVIVKPAFCLMIALGIFHLLPETLPLPSGIPVFVGTAVQIGFVCVCYGLMLFLFHQEKYPASPSVNIRQ
ncbi:MAG: polysaccharide biosynthesis protein [Lachnospiraceae bacterium]|nr:polysaccharide biosynthesis protein [Lachnospiraceae bacterium]